MSTAHAPVYEWKEIPWTTVQRNVFKLQTRIYQASQRGDVRGVHRLQRLLMKSWSARLLAVRRVTQDNRGKRTAGVDGVKNLPPSQRLRLTQTLSLAANAQPTRRVWIAKRGTAERRPLGIPTLHDRAAQALVKLSLEPEWEAKFEPNSYGFRPGRSGHDAIEAIFSGIVHKPKYVLDADITKCFDRINHQALLVKLQTYPSLRRLIRNWLRAGVMEGQELFPTQAGTPQGGVISPLLANIALHGLETSLRMGFSRDQRPRVIRYADDFVVLHSDRAVIEKVKERAIAWLCGMGLELKPSKTRIAHSLQPLEGQVGFDFLGFCVRQYPVGKTHTGKTGRKRSVPLGFKTLIKPSKPAQSRHLAELAEIVHRHQTAPQQALIAQLNPVIRGWANYFATVAAKQTFSRLDHLTFLKLYRWANRRHPNKNRHWIAGKYWRLETGRWDFAPRGGMPLLRHKRIPIWRHCKVQGARSPYDGDWLYWASRLGRHPELPPSLARLLKQQQGRCGWCGLYLTMEDLRERDHILPLSLGGGNGYPNLQLLHGHCHDQKTAQDGSCAQRGISDKDQPSEEPDDRKRSSPVLKAGR